jgi:hypothetical protein
MEITLSHNNNMHKKYHHLHPSFDVPGLKGADHGTE